MTKTRIALAAMLLTSLTTLACDGPTLPPRASSSVYDFRLASDTFHVFHWPSGKEVRVYIVQNPDSSLNAQLASAFERGAEQWNTRALFDEYHLTRTSSLADADAVLRFSTDLPPVNTTACTPTFSNAVTTFCIDDPDAAQLHLATFHPLSPADTTSGHVKMLVTVLTTSATISGRLDRLVAHELGHVLGIGQHSPDPSDLMAAGIPPRADLSARDAATVQVLYHTVADILP
jgi:hypothetical protein